LYKEPPLSPLTKLFVVLNVLFSLILTAAIVVYVNKEDVQKTTLTSTEAQLQAAQAEAQTAHEQLLSAQQNLTAVQQQANAQANRMNSELVARQNEIGKLNVELAKATSAAASQGLDISRLTEALNASQATTAQFQQQVASLRGNNDKLVQQSADLSSRVTDLTNKLDVTEKERQHLAEQVTQTSADNQRLNAVVAAAHLTPEQQQMLVNRSGAPAINGVIRDVRNIDGVDYATISVGAADGVQQGMEFKVIDRTNGNFLGTVTVNSVDPNQATGRLAGPNIAAIKPGVEVKTQL
jgi:chromosome segregation ATPase